jgi:hypothetical protein
MWRFVTAVGAAAIAASIAANLGPAIARPAGPGPAIAHPQAVQHPMTGGGINGMKMNGMNLCDLPACKGGSSRAIGGPAGRGPTHPSLASRHPLVTQPPSVGDWKHPCDEPMCHHHHHHHHFESDFAFFQSNEPYVYQPQPDCWLWSHRLHHWIWVCGPYYPNY